MEEDTKIQSTQTLWSAKGWAQGLVPNLWLIEIVLAEHMLEAFIGRDNTLSRQQLDALHSENSSVDFWEGVMIDFNDPSKPRNMNLLCSVQVGVVVGSNKVIC